MRFRQSFAVILFSLLILASCENTVEPVSILPVTIDSSAAPSGKLVFVRETERFVSDDYFKDTSGIYHGAYAFYQLSTQELSIYGRKEGEKPEVIHIVTSVPVKQVTPDTIANYTIEYQEGIILKGKAFQTDSVHYGRYILTKFDLGAGLISGTFESPLRQTFPITENDVITIQHGSFKDLPMIIFD